METLQKLSRSPLGRPFMGRNGTPTPAAPAGAFDHMVDVIGSLDELDDEEDD